MRHPEDQLIPYLCGELDMAARGSIERHLTECAACRAQRAMLAKTLSQIKSGIEQMPAPAWEPYRAELRRKLAARREQPLPQPWWRVNLVWGSLAAGVAAVALLALTLSRGPSSQESPIMDQIAMADTMSHTDVDLLRDYPVVQHLDLLENYDVIEHLDEVAPPQTNPTTQS